jgi:hypothetical protein
VVGWATSYAPNPEKEKACYQAAAKSGYNTEQCKSLWERTATDPVALFTLVLSFATIGLWITTLNGIRRQSNETKILQRAYLSTAPRGLHTTAIAHVALINGGNLPARNVRNEVKIGWFDDQRDKSDFEPVQILEPGKIFIASKADGERGTSALDRNEALGLETPYGLHLRLGTGRIRGRFRKRAVAHFLPSLRGRSTSSAT